MISRMSGTVDAETTTNDSHRSQETSMNWYREISAPEKRTLWGCFAGWALDGIDTQLFSLVIPALIATWGIGKGQAGLIGGATLVAGALGGLAAGVLSDRIGRVRA